ARARRGPDPVRAGGGGDADLVASRRRLPPQPRHLIRDNRRGVRDRLVRSFPLPRGVAGDDRRDPHSRHGPPAGGSQSNAHPTMSSDARRPDFEAKGLVNGLDGEVRDARLRLLERLFDRDATLEQLREAVAEDRLVALSAELVLSDERRYTAREIAELAEVPVELFLALLGAGGLVEPDPEDVAFGERDLSAARLMAGFNRAGFDREGMREVARVLGRGMAQAADAMGELFSQTFVKAGVSEHELALQNAEAAGVMLPAVTTLMDGLLN